MFFRGLKALNFRFGLHFGRSTVVIRVHPPLYNIRNRVMAILDSEKGMSKVGRVTAKSTLCLAFSDKETIKENGQHLVAAPRRYAAGELVREFN